MANKLDWLIVEVQGAYESAERIHNEPMRERYQSWLSALQDIAAQQSVQQTDCGLCPVCHEPLVNGVCPAFHALQDTPRR